MPFLDKNGLEHLTKKIVQAENIKVISPRGHTVKNVIDNINRECSDIKTPHTMTLVNETGQFKVGEGQGGVDVSGDVEQGKFDFQLEGKTFKNCVDSTFAGCRTNASKKANIVRLDGNSKYSQVNFNLPVDTEYTFFIKVLNNKLASGTRTDVNKAYCISTTNNETEVIRSISNGVTGMLPPFSLIGKDGGSWGERNVWFEISDAKGGHVDLEIYIFEGKLKEFPLGITDYFEGLSSTGEKEKNVVKIVLQGQNLVKNSNDYSVNNQYEVIEKCPESFMGEPVWKATKKTGGTPPTRFLYTKILPGETYTLSVFAKEKKGNSGICCIAIYDGSHFLTYNPKKFEGEWGRLSTTFTNTTNKPIDGSFYFYPARKPGDVTYFTCPQIEKLGEPTPYESYQNDTKQIQLPHPLRKVGDVADRIYEKDGKVWLEQNIKELKLSDVEEWLVAIKTEASTELFYTHPIEDMVKYSKNLCDRFKHIRDVYSDEEGIFVDKDLNIRVDKSKGIERTQEAFKQWLSENPTTVLYQLETPITTELKPFGINIKPHTTIKIENSILPKITYEVQLNRSAQIENSIKSIQSLRQRIDKLEKHYDNHLLENQYKIDLLKLEKGDEL